MKLTNKLKEKINNYFNNMTAEKLYDILVKKYNFQEINYTSPVVKIIQIKVEKGFALSNIEKDQKYFKLMKVNDGGRAW